MHYFITVLIFLWKNTTSTEFLFFKTTAYLMGVVMQTCRGRGSKVKVTGTHSEFEPGLLILTLKK